MAVTEEPTQVDERPSLASPRPPARARTLNPTWVLVLLGVLAAIALAVVALRPDADPAVGNHRLIIENGSIAAVDHAAEVERGGVSEGGRTGNHRLIIENGSITAVDHAAEVERGGVPEGGRIGNDVEFQRLAEAEQLEHSAHLDGQWWTYMGRHRSIDQPSDFVPGSRHMPTR